MEVLIFVGIVMLVVLFVMLIAGAGSSSSSSTSLTDIRRSGDATIDNLRRTSQSFREHIDRKTK